MKSKYNMFIFLILMIPAISSGAEKYKFKTVWPALPQAWYFSHPSAAAINRSGYVYVADQENYRIRKLTSDGCFVTEWKTTNPPIGIAIDSSDFVYVIFEGYRSVKKFDSDGRFVSEWLCKFPEDTDAFSPSAIASDTQDVIYLRDSYRRRIYKFTKDGQNILRWSDNGSIGNEQYPLPDSIATDSRGFVYITDAKNKCVQKFDSDGKFIAKWGNGQFVQPFGIAVSDQSVYVGDVQGQNVQIFDLNGNFIDKLRFRSSDEGQFYSPYGIAADKNGSVYVADSNQRSILKFASNGIFVSAWQSMGSRQGMFETPRGMAIGKDGVIYIADTNNSRIQKFDSSGTFIAQWGKPGADDGQFDTPYGVAVDPQNNVYVLDTLNNRIQKFDSDGNFLAKWGQQGSEEGLFNDPEGITIDSKGFIYAADTKNNRIQQFDSNGNFQKVFTDPKSEFFEPSGIVVVGNILYAADKYKNRIYQFDINGTLKKTFGESGSSNGQFDIPSGIAADIDGNIYVADTRNNRIQKFDSDGNFITSFAEFGSAPGQIRKPFGIAVDDKGIVYVSDSENNRIQVFRKIDPNEKISKAIIVAGGGPFPGNALWDSTRMAANFAYQGMRYQGISKENIRYFSKDNIDLDNNGKADDIADIPTTLNIKAAITTWAEDADTLVVYLTDHGKNEKFYLSDTEILSADDLNSWLDQYQNSKPDKRVIVIYDACMSGSFISALSANNRIIIASTSADEDAYFISQGSLSFSDAFWSDIFNGNHVRKSFGSAKQAVAEFQNPMIGIGSGISGEVFIGNGTSYNREAPVIENVLCASAGSRITCTATAGGKDGIARVWAVIMPSDYDIGILSRPVVELPSFELMPDSNDEKKYTGTYDNYHIRNIRIAVYAEDRNGNTSAPSLTYLSGMNVSEDRAVIAAGDDFGTSAKQAEDALKFQRYGDGNIMRVSAAEELHEKLADCASADTHDVLVYLVGRGSPGSFRIGNTESLSAAALNLWLNDLQEKITGKVIVIYDADYPGSFIPLLKPPQGKERILISGTSDTSPAVILPDTGAAFSYFFWNGIHNGVNIRDSFRYAADIIGFLSIPGSSRLDDNGNGIGNEISDGQLSLNTLIGLGIRVAGAFPGDVRGTISDSYGNPVAGARILTDADVGATSLPNGKFLMPPHPAGTFLITVEATGYQIATAEISVTEWGITVKDIRLIPLPEQPPSPDITPPPAAPVPDVSVSGTTATVSWDAVSGATGYRLLYRYPPDTGYISIDIGNRTGLSAELPEGTVLYVAVQAYNDAGSGISSDARYISIPLSRLDVGHAGDDLKLDISCALYDGNQYSVSLIPSPQPSDTLIWKADIGSFGKITESPTPCLAVGDDLKLRLTAEYGGSRYSFTLNYADPLTWKMDTDTFKKQ